MHNIIRVILLFIAIVVIFLGALLSNLGTVAIGLGLLGVPGFAFGDRMRPEWDDPPANLERNGSPP